MSPRLGVAALAVAAGLTTLPYAGRTLSPDEGGLLLLASQWSPGTSLYGDYFIDRPPGLIALVALADALADGLGGGWALRLLGALAVVTAVLLSGLIGRLAAPGRAAAPLLTAAVAALLTTSPLFGGTVVNGELLGVPFLLGGMAAALRAATARPGAATGWAVLAGGAGACGALVKQSLLDVFVVVLVLAVLGRRWRLAAGAAIGAALTGTAVIAVAWTRGTDPAELWQATVVFRSQAAAVIAESATDSTARRLGGMLLALAATGAPVLVAMLARRLPRRAAPGVPDLRCPALAVLGWELVVVLLGGSYWLHYLMGLVPGLVLLAAAACQRPPPSRRAMGAAYGLLAASTLSALTWVLVHPIERPEEPAIEWLREHARAGDTAVVAFGAANILQATGMSSPYPDLWSLPVRVHDPGLARLSGVLGAEQRPTWVVVAGASLGTWGVDATTADRVLADHYRLAATVGGWTIYRESDR